MKINIAYMILVLLAAATPFTHADMGFYFFDEDPVPPALVSIPDTVFQLVTPGEHKKSVDITGWNDSQIQDFAEDVAQNRWRPDLRAASIQHQLQICAHFEISKCAYMDDLVTSSSFLLENPRLVVASFHGVEKAIEPLKEMSLSESQILSIEMPWALMNSDGQVIRWTSKAKALLPKKGYEGDLLLLEANGLPAKGLPYDPYKTIDSGTLLYASGFPSNSKGRERFGKKNAILDKLSYTTGTLTDSLNLSRSTMKDYIYAHQNKTPMNNPYFITDLDGISGMSGGPLLTEDGYVIGYMVLGTSSKTTRRATSLFVNLPRIFDQLGITTAPTF